MAAARPLGWEFLIVVMDFVRLSVFPFIFLAIGSSTRLELMGWGAFSHRQLAVRQSDS